MKKTKIIIITILILFLLILTSYLYEKNKNDKEYIKKYNESSKLKGRYLQYLIDINETLEYEKELAKSKECEDKGGIRTRCAPCSGPYWDYNFKIWGYQIYKKILGKKSYCTAECISYCMLEPKN